MPSTTVLKSSGLFGFTPISNRFITEMLASAPGDAVKVYLYGLMLATESGDGAGDELHLALGMTEQQVDEAFRHLERVGAVRLISGGSGDTAVQYLPLERSDGYEVAANLRYSSLISKLQAVIGTRNFSGAELRRVYDWIEVFRFEEDAAVELVRHCISIKGARVHINYMDSVAKRLAADGTLTLAEVKRSFEREEELSGGAAAILKRWRISRRPTDDELALYEKWKGEWGFDEDAIELACGAVVATDRPSFKYLDAVLANYRESGSISADGIRELMREQDMLHELARQAFTRAGLKRSASARDREQFGFWLHEYGMDTELILYAAELSAEKASPFAEMKRIIADWHSCGIADYRAAKADRDAQGEGGKGSRTTAQGGRTNRALGYRQQHYTAEQLKALGVDLGEDIYNDED